MEEGDAIARLKSGDISGLEYLVRKYQVEAVRVAYMVCRDRPLAEDIAQTAFINVFERIGSFDETRPFRGWFLRSVVNAALTASTRGKRTVSLENALHEDDAALARLDPALEEGIHSAEVSAAISAALAQLPPQQRAAIVLRYYLGMNESEMSAQLNCAPGTSRWHLHRARQRLKKLLPAWVRGMFEEPQDQSSNPLPLVAQLPNGDTQ
ncbi:MAG TPA: sigma-70 family RNA polymerase sigma factor [Chloroflexia bacterium]|nr:sigma-70 family RNA polymerase sigma factor [Chloroflexia bacterium]